MTLTPLLIYAINLSDNLIVTSAIVIIFCIIIITFTLVFQCDYNEKWNGDKKKIKTCPRWRKRAFIGLTISTILAMLLPSSNTLTMMYILPTLSNSQIIQKLPDEFQQYINQVLVNPHDSH
ncbi:MAG TPA: hypothetical protein VHZ76_00875 [Gammaproteobacteria bacterium]|jgi:archaellum biogenesis protein FlaJ (TadC family)|nr:hypothetical protein [Gammaproteobacteria bacterium]